MSIGAIQTEGDLRQFILRELESSDLDALVRQLQGDAQTGVLRLAIPGTQRKIALGSATLTWPGGTPFTNTLTQAHGLATTPIGAWGTAQLPAGGSPCLVHATNLGATNIDFRGHATDGTAVAAATTRTFYWVAIG